MRKSLALALALGLLTGAVSSAGAAPKAVTVMEDPAGDADNAQGVGQSVPGGFDMVGGSIQRVGSDLQFVVTHADMPPVGSIPETFRFLWAFSVGSTSYRLTAKTADVGKPDVLAGQTSDRVGSVDPQGHFRLEGNCQAGATVGVLQPINCEALEYLEGSFDAAAKTLTVIVPMAAVKAKPGTVVSAGAGDATAICSAAACWVSHLGERSHSDTLIDIAFQLKSYKIPR